MIYSFEYLLRTTSAIMLVTNRFCEGTITPQIKSPAFKLILDGVFLIGGVYNIFLWVCSATTQFYLSVRCKIGHRCSLTFTPTGTFSRRNH